MHDWELAGLRGPVAVCQTEQTTPGFVSRHSFRTDGQLTQKWHRNGDGSEWSVSRRYDGDGRLVAEEGTGPHGRTLLYQ